MRNMYEKYREANALAAISRNLASSSKHREIHDSEEVRRHRSKGMTCRCSRFGYELSTIP